MTHLFWTAVRVAGRNIAELGGWLYWAGKHGESRTGEARK